MTGAAVTSETLIAAILNAHRIFARAGLVVTVSDAHNASRTADDSNRRLRVVLADAAAAPREVLGMADLASATAWVFVQNVQAAVRASGAHEGIILGHVIAHELGHLLIGSRQHSVSGLMAETLSLSAAEQGVLSFSPDDVRRIRTRLAHELTVPR